MEYRLLGDYVRELDNRNSDLACSNLLGVSIKKEFMDSKSDKSTLNLANYKLVEPRQFSYVTVTSRNGEKISIALNESDTGLVSSTYVTFEVIDEEKLIPEYLLLWFKRKEFDRYARYHSWGSARETFDWGDMCKVELPVPPIEEQRKIVTFYNSYSKKSIYFRGRSKHWKKLKSCHSSLTFQLEMNTSHLVITFENWTTETPISLARIC